MSEPTRREPIGRESLMRYLDGELPPEDRARVEAAVAGSTELQRELAIFRAMKQDLHDLSFSVGPPPTSVWGRVNRRLTRPVGWVLLVVGLTTWTGYGAYVFATSPARLLEKLAAGAVAVGVLLLLASVAYDRYRDWLVDPYRDVQR